jgi:hypothetical protein
MNVGQLIKQLEKLDPELMVVVRGYEGGVNEVVSHTVCNIAIDANKGEWYYGRHEVMNKTTKVPTVKAVKLNGDNNS